jgi:DNA-binding MarR family transcriptional regulator
MRNIITHMVDALTATDVELFGSLVVFMQQLMLRMDELLEPFGLTSRQWALLAAIDKGFPEGYAPTLSEATAVFGTSRQNVKQVALQLERRGWLRLELDPTDRRMLRLVLTDQRAVFDDPAVRATQGTFILSVLGGLTPREREAWLRSVRTCMSHLSSPPNQPPTSTKDRQ